MLQVIILSTTVIFKLLNTSCSLLVLCILIISVIPYNYNFNNCRLLQFSSDRDNMEWKMVSCWERNFALIVPPPLQKMSQKNENYYCTCLATKILKKLLAFHIITVYEVTCFSTTVPLPRKCNDMDLIGNHYNTWKAILSVQYLGNM